MENQKKRPLTLDAKAGKMISVVGDTYRILIGGAETNGAFALIDMLIPPDGGPGPHEHAQIEESFYVIDGEIEVKSEFGVYIATKGSFVNIPKGGVVHGFKNKTDKIAHLLCVVVLPKPMLAVRAFIHTGFYSLLMFFPILKNKS